MLLAATKDPLFGYILIAALLLFWAGIIAWGRSVATVCKIAVNRDLVVVSLCSPARILSLRKQVVFPLDSVVSVTSTPNIFSKEGSFSRRIGSVSLPTFFRVGSFKGFRDAGPAFWACFRGETAVTFELENDRYRYVVLDVNDPQEVIGLLKKYGI
ncbi:MAG: hypothetical protein HKL84_03245 [Acidimicrobiaceae bacterium]|nr:hypothetical protein [Acidimicrobiaceae bacterium]